MKFRDHYFKREATVSDSDTVIIDINVKNPISAIVVEYEATNGATSSTNHEIHDDVSSIELVDGSRVLWSLSMNQARALNFFETGILPHSVQTEIAAAVQESKCVLHFGRVLDDPEFYIRPSDYNNLQLRLTHALTISATAGFATGTGKVTVMARIIDQGATVYKGFMMAKEKVSYTSGTSGDKEVDLPRDYPYRIMMLKALVTTVTHQEVLTQHKLSIDADAYIPFNMYSEDIDDMNRSKFGLAKEKKIVLATSADVRLCDLYNIEDGFIRCETTLVNTAIEAVDAEAVTIGATVVTVAPAITVDVTDRNHHITVYGTQPNSNLAIPFGRLDSPSDWLPAPEYGDIRLISTQAAAAACAVVLQQWAV
jgi:hypothetical protein